VTGDVHYAILGFRKRKVNVLTIHDCVMLHKNPRGPRHWLMKRLWYELPVKKADAVTVISENTKRELLRFTKCDPEKIRVIPDFVDPAFRPSGRGELNRPPRVLFIGSTPNKNLERLIMALEGLPVRLEMVGVPDEKQLRLLQQHHIDYRQSAGLTQEELLAKYEECDLLAFPTTYEGFGLPIVEAQAVGRPVLTSDLPPMNDVAGDGAVLVDPYRVDAIRQGILSILGDADLRLGLVERGFRNVQRFRLENVAEQYVSLYRELLQLKPIIN
jgi:glycosyltransferase involved in cell wall biosynthesis